MTSASGAGRAVLFGAAAAMLALLAGCSRPAPLFSETNARAHLNMIAGTIGSRPVGTPANARARDYLVDQLKLYGYSVRLQTTEAQRPEYGLTARVTNIVATRAGAKSGTIALLAHYDSVAAAPGATDDGLGLAVALEAGRVLAARPDRQHSLAVLLTDAEEAGLMGAVGLLNDPGITRDILTYLNIESIGSDGPAVLFETGPGNGWLIDVWARSAARPRGSSYTQEIYARLPNDTDFSIVKRTGIPGFNFAPTGDSYAYHTARDTPERLSPSTIRQTGQNVVSIVEALDRMDLSRRALEPSIYFDVGERFGVSYRPWAGRLIAALALLFGAAAGVRSLIGAVRVEGPLRFALSVVWSFLGAAAAAAAMWGVVIALRLSREVYHPWYAHPGPLFVLIIVAGGAAAWLVSRAGALMPARWRALRSPSVVWAITLPIWTALAGLSEWRSPAASHRWTIPLLAAGLLLAFVSTRSSALVRVASVVILGVTGIMWIPDATALLQFLVPVFGRLSIVTPEFVYPAALFVTGLMVAPPLLAILLTREPFAMRSSIITGAWLLALTVSAGLAYAAPAYTERAPLRRFVRYVEDRTVNRAFWEVASIEPGLDLAAGAPGEWQPASGTPPLSVPWPRSRYPFVFRAEVPASNAAAGTATSVMTNRENEVELEVVANPAEPGMSVIFALPAGLTPLRSSLPGVSSGSPPAWTATYAGAPTEGVVFRAAFRRDQEQMLGGTVVIFRTPALPGGTGWQRIPAWLPQQLAVWESSASFIVGLAPPATPPVPGGEDGTDAPPQ